MFRHWARLRPVAALSLAVLAITPGSAQTGAAPEGPVTVVVEVALAANATPADALAAMNGMRALCTIPTCSLVAAPDATAQSRGELLYTTHCIACHTTAMHWRDKRSASNWPALKAQVRRWQDAASLAWGDGDILDVSRHLNETIYHCEQTTDPVSSSGRGVHEPVSRWNDASTAPAGKAELADQGPDLELPRPMACRLRPLGGVGDGSVVATAPAGADPGHC